jgi:hypothetical protein
MISFYPGYFGWLGNEMFQYATTFAASKRLGVDCAFPQNNPDLFEVFQLSSKKIDTAQGTVYQEPSFQYTPIPKEDNLTLHGYFQSEKYFEDYKKDIRQEFRFKNQKVSELLPNTVSLHVRRGDYMNHPNHHPLCSMEYYHKAMEEFKGYNFLVFSDDKEWCRENFKQDSVYVSEVDDAVEELEMMSWCEHHIIANSTFSWWGAWLGQNDDKKIVAPKKWFGSAYQNHDTKDLYAKDWLTL